MIGVIASMIGIIALIYLYKLYRETKAILPWAALALSVAALVGKNVAEGIQTGYSLDWYEIFSVLGIIGLLVALRWIHRLCEGYRRV